MQADIKLKFSTATLGQDLKKWGEGIWQTSAASVFQTLSQSYCTISDLTEHCYGNLRVMLRGRGHKYSIGFCLDCYT